MTDVEVLDRSEIIRREVDRESAERALAVMDPAVLDTLFASRDPAAIVTRIEQVSSVLMEAVHQRDLARRYGNNESEFLHIEAWEFLSSMLGMTMVGVDSRPLPDGSGYEATAELRHVASGRVLGRRDGMAQRTEPQFQRQRGGPTADNTLRQMAQIRAARAAARSVLGFVPKIGGFEISDPQAPATREQVVALHTIAGKLGWDDVERHRAAGVESFNDLTREQASALQEAWSVNLPGTSEPRPAGEAAEVPPSQVLPGNADALAYGEGAATPSSPGAPPTARNCNDLGEPHRSWKRSEGVLRCTACGEPK